MAPQESYTIRGRSNIAYFFFAFLALPITLSFIIDKFDKRLLILLAAWLVLSVVLYVLCRTTQIHIDDERFTYRSPYGKKFIVRWAEIKLSSLEITPQGLNTIMFHWKFETFAGKEVNIELGYFSRTNMRQFAKQTILRTKGALLSPTIYQIAKGKFPWYIF